MKKLFLILLAVLMLTASAWAFIDEYMDNSTQQTGDAFIYNGAGYLYGLIANMDGTNDVVVQVYDGSSSAGTAKTPAINLDTTADAHAATLSFDPPIPVNVGIFVDITTSGTVNWMGYYRGK